jgi:hypothetical protein
LLLDPLKNPAELVFVLLLLLDPPNFRHPPIAIHKRNPAESAFLARYAGKSDGTCFCFIFVPEFAGNFSGTFFVFFVAESAEKSGETCFCFVFVAGSARFHSST